tara:strand:+ start:14316 stop:15020 length:705 start_codon:yes stop_codon:yes gene_type:complete
MKELIQINETENGRAVSARELHEVLKVKSDFSHWCKRMFEYGFQEDIDFASFSTKSTGGRPSTDYALSIDCAKEISMLQRTEVGKKVRLYFIQKEKEALNPYANLNKLDALRLAVEAEERNQLLEEQIKIQAPTVAYANKVLDSKATYVTNQIAKELGTSAVTLNRMLNKLNVIYKQNGTWLLYAKYQNKGFSKTKTYTYTDSEGNQKTSMQLVWLEKGRKFIHELFNQNLKIA